MEKSTILPPSPSKEYWEDSQWALEHATELSEQYPNQWVAIVNKEVIATGRDGSEVEKITVEKTGRQEFVIIFAEQGIHVYHD